LPVTDWVSCRTTGFERHSPDRKLSCLPSYKNAEGEELRASPQVMTPVDRLSSPRGLGERP
jgi:hypothetical protein